jgi:hypothetical protein
MPITDDAIMATNDNRRDSNQQRRRCMVGIVVDYNIEERFHLIMSEKRWDNQLT